MCKKRKPVQRCDSTTKYPFYSDLELLAIEAQEIHIPSTIGDIVSQSDAPWDIIDELIDANICVDWSTA